MVALFGTMVLNKKEYFLSLSQQYSISSNQLEDIQSKKDVILRKHSKYNHDGIGLNDRAKCPSQVSFSGWLYSTVYTQTWTVSFCSGSIDSTHLELYFTDDALDFIGWLYGMNTFPLTQVDTSRMANLSGQTLSFNKETILGGYATSGFVDDYKWNQYTASIEDDDALAREKIIGYVSDDFLNIFWNGKPVRSLISANTNNVDTAHISLWSVSTWSVYLDVESNFELNIVEFDRSLYEVQKRLIKTKEWTFEWNGSGYINADYSNLTTDISQSANFDFAQNDYAFFLKASPWVSSDYLYYEMSILQDNKHAYIVPIRDDLSGFLQYLGYDIVKMDNLYLLSTKKENFTK